MNAPKYLKAHPMYSDSDYQYLRGKGCTNHEIKTIWARDAARSCEPLTHQPIPDIVPSNPKHICKEAAIMNHPNLKDRADVFHLSLYAPRVMGIQAAGPITKPGTPLPICEEIARRTPGWTVHTDVVERLTISRPDRPSDSRTYDLMKHSATARRAIAYLLIQDWPTRCKTAAGWDGYSNIP